MKILTLNIWRYFDWEKRKSNLIKFLKKENADIVFLQEVAFDDRLKWDNQVQEINFELNYKSKAFCKLREMTFWNNVPIDWIMYYGQGFLTKYPIIKTQEVLLKPVLKEQGLGFLYVQVKTPEGKLDLINVHFENTDLGSEQHLKETLKWCKNKKIQPIIAGDFNMIKTEILVKHALKDYEISYLFKPYKSFMPTEFSYNKEPVTLDYILIPKKFKFNKLQCITNKVSDHNPLIVEVSPRGN